MGTRITAHGAERVYAAAALWVERALQTDDSLFTPGRPIWSSRWLGELRERFLDHPDESKDSFREKLRHQLEGSPPEVYQLMGEALHVYFLIVSTKDSTDEQRVIDSVLGWSPTPVVIPPNLVAGLTPGIANPGAAFHTYRHIQVGFLIEFVERLKKQEPAECRRMVDNPWAFKDFLIATRPRSNLLRNYQYAARIQREALLHLVHPDTFEAIVSTDHKKRIAETLSNLVTQPTDDIDRQLEQIRSTLEAKYETGDHLFYKREIQIQWDPVAANLWDKFVRHTRQYFDTGKLDSEENDYKVDIGRKLEEAREAALASSDDWAGLLRRALNPNDVNFVTWRLISNLNQWCVRRPDEALRALQAIWAQDDSSASERIHAFSGLLPHSEISGAGTRTNVASGLLMGVDVYSYPPFRITTFNEAYERTGYDPPEQDADEAALYEHALGFLDRFIEEASKRGLTLRHRLDAQSLVWGVVQGRDEPDEPMEREDALLAPLDLWTPPNIEALAKELLWETGELRKIIDGLKDKGQVIFQGPPGTGKTFAAKRIAEWCRDYGGDFQMVQFHPSYSYEDFVEGFRPTLSKGGQAGFELREGPLRRMASEAEASPHAVFVLVIDEINRGNVAKVLGELYFLLEYRDEDMTLQYSAEAFRLPRNLWFIGTMNTTDRSIALVDAALRRRFYFFGFFPDEPPVKGLLSRWLADSNPQLKWVADLVDLANGKLEDRQLGIGPSHFMKNDPPLNEDRVRFIWERAVMPYIEEHFFGDNDKLKEFAYDQLRQELDGTGPGPDAGAIQPEGTTAEGNGQL